jgi:hypothetical protein
MADNAVARVENPPSHAMVAFPTLLSIFRVGASLREAGGQTAPLHHCTSAGTDEHLNSIPNAVLVWRMNFSSPALAEKPEEPRLDRMLPVVTLAGRVFGLCLEFSDSARSSLAASVD